MSGLRKEDVEKIVEDVVPIIVHLQSTLYDHKATILKVLKKISDYKSAGKTEALIGIGRVLDNERVIQEWNDNIVPLLRKLKIYSPKVADMIYRRVVTARIKEKEIAHELNRRPPTDEDMGELYRIAEAYDLSLMF